MITYKVLRPVSETENAPILNGFDENEVFAFAYFEKEIEKEAPKEGEDKMFTIRQLAVRMKQTENKLVDVEHFVKGKKREEDKIEWTKGHRDVPIEYIVENTMFPENNASIDEFLQAIKYKK